MLGSSVSSGISEIGSLLNLMSIPIVWICSFLVKIFAFMWLIVVDAPWSVENIPMYLGTILIGVTFVTLRPFGRVLGSVAILLYTLDAILLIFSHHDMHQALRLGILYLIADCVFTYLWYADVEEVPFFQRLLTYLLAPVFSVFGIISAITNRA